MRILQRTVDSPRGTIELFEIINSRSARVILSSLGAGIVAISVPDRDGNIGDVLMGYENPADYIGDGPCAGKIPGRYANRIALGHFTLDGRQYTLPVNNGPNSLHGGPEGFQNKIWAAEVTADNAVTFTLTSPDGDMGYPGTVLVRATYTWDDDCRLTLTMEAVTDANTVINLTNHAYFNLGGVASGSALDQTLWMACSRYLPTDGTQIPTGELAPVAGTPMDFTTPKKIGCDIKADFEALRIGKGYDSCWAVDDYAPGVMKIVARLSDDRTGRVLEISSDQPGVQLYTGNWLDGSPLGIGGYQYHDYDAVAIECQDFPDAPNKPQFPSTELKPGQIYLRHIQFRFFNR